MVVKVFGIRTNNCSDFNVACSRVLLLNTSFRNNFAHQSGAALVVTKMDGILVSCDKESEIHDRHFMNELTLQIWIKENGMKELNSTNPCPSWHGNKLSHGASGGVIGTFGHKLSIANDSGSGHQLFNDTKYGFILPNVSSGRELPKLIITTLDAFGNCHAPTLHEKDAITLESKVFLQQMVSFSFVDGTCIIEDILGFVRPGKYAIQVIPRSDDILEPTRLTLVVRSCEINEEPARNGTFCEKCDEGSYNFESVVGNCALCPKGANCSETYIVPIDGYWHKSPCHDKMKKCIIEEACNHSNRTRKLTHLTQNSINCNFNRTTLQEYEEAQCNKVSMSMLFQNGLLEIVAYIRVMKVVFVEVARKPMENRQTLIA